MYKVAITEKWIQNIKKYISNYRQYHEEVYIDSWIWSEMMIIEKYIEESENRFVEIQNFLKSKLSQKLPSYPQGQAILRWRTKILLVSFYDENITRIITDIDIR